MKKAYIIRAILKDYLTIKEVDVTFNKDINIIIGKNGVGKTNFINYLADSLELEPAMHRNFSEIFFNFKDENYSKKTTKRFITFITGENIAHSGRISDVKFFKGDTNINNDLPAASISCAKILHGIPAQYYLVNEPINDIIKIISEGAYSIFPTYWKSAFISDIGYKYVMSVLAKDLPKIFDSEWIFEKLNDSLSKYSNIKKVRLGQNLVINNSDKEEIHFNNLYLEFLVNDEWLLFNQLSDGTKRLFYIISEVIYTDYSIILLEEPELGLHPHQLYDLLRFIKEYSAEKQFIITTHSPLVLNMLDKDQLDSIIIAKFEDKQTKLVHLTEEQKQKAQAYMEDLDLSDYWVHSDLED